MIRSMLIFIIYIFQPHENFFSKKKKKKKKQAKAYGFSGLKKI